MSREMGKIMATPHNKFTDEQIAELKANKFVKNIGRSFVYFNDDFKEQFWRMYDDEHLTPQEILSKLGVDHQLLGQKRIQGLIRNLRKKFEHETEVERKLKPRKRPEFMTPERQIRQLSAEVEYLRQENEFLKKSYRRARRAGDERTSRQEIRDNRRYDEQAR